MKKNVASVLMGLIVGLWLIFFIKHIEFIIMTILCAIALRYLFSEFDK